MPDKIEIEILEDGTIKSSTDVVSAPNHQNAENFLKSMWAAMGGAVTIKAKKGKHLHSHTHGHGAGQHTHQ